MKLQTILIGIILITGITFLITSCRNKSTESNQLAATQERVNPKIHKTEQNLYEEMRNMAFKVKPEELGLSLPQDKFIVYGLVMDWEMGGAIATTVSYQTGDASLYLSTGGAVIGGGQHKNVNSAAKKLVTFAQTLLENATKVETPALPENQEVIFYFLTNKGIYAGKDKMVNFENNSSVWIKLFEEGNNLLTELRQVSEK